MTAAGLEFQDLRVFSGFASSCPDIPLGEDALAIAGEGIRSQYSVFRTLKTQEWIPEEFKRAHLQAPRLPWSSSA